MMLDKKSSTFDPVLDTPVWGAAKISRVIDRSTRQTFYLLERGHIDADRIGSRWCSTPRRLLRPQSMMRGDTLVQYSKRRQAVDA